MQTTNAEFLRRLMAPSMALLLLTVFAAPADADRGGRGGSHHGHYGGHGGSGHHGSYGHGSHRYGRHHGTGGYHYRGKGYGGYRGHYGYRGTSGHYRGYSYRSYGRYGGYAGYRNHGYRNYGYRGGYAYPSYYGYPPAYRYQRNTGSYVYYQGYPVTIYYQSSPGYSISYDPPRETRPGYEGYVPSITIPGPGVTESGEAYSTEPYDARQAPARVKLAIEPGDASVYLNGEFLGLASELPPELLLEPGAHRLKIARPGFDGRDVELELESGEELEVEAQLSADVPE